MVRQLALDIIDAMNSEWLMCFFNVCISQDSCVAGCLPGYEGHGSTFVCQATQQWSGDYTDACHPVDCGSSIHNAQELGVTASCAGKTIFGGDACLASCARGFQGNSSLFYCGSDGNWVGESQCKPIECGRPAVMDKNVRFDCVDTIALGEGCRTRCAVGRKTFSSTDFKCNARGQWEGFIECIPPPSQNATEIIDTNTATSASVDEGTVIGAVIGSIGVLLLVVVVILALKLRASRRKAVPLSKRLANAQIYESNMMSNPSHALYKQSITVRHLFSVYIFYFVCEQIYVLR